MTNEKWVPVPQYEGYYEVSDLGVVRSLDRTWTRRDGVPFRRKGRVIRPSTGRYGHQRLVLHHDEKPDKTMTVHRIVAIAFLGLKSDLVVCHENGDPKDNRLSNLRWDTLSSNSLDMERHGTNRYRNRTHCVSGHLLEHPNLVSGKIKAGLRGCRACHQANSDQFLGSVLSPDQSKRLRYQMVMSAKRFKFGQRREYEARYLENGEICDFLDELEGDKETS